MKEHDKKHSNVKIIKIAIAILIPLIFLQFILYSNLTSHDFGYFYDIGSQSDNYLSPANRISDKLNDSNADYRNLTGGLVYFNIPVSNNKGYIDISVRFKDNFPEKSGFSLGAKNQENWSYAYNQIHSPILEKLIHNGNYETEGSLSLFKLNKNAQDYTIQQILTNPPAIRLATNQNITLPEFNISNYSPENFEINTALRGSLTFYVYIKGNFEVGVWKRDLNWYDYKSKGEDELSIRLYDLNDVLLSSETIPDDGERGKDTDKDNKKTQLGNLYAQGLKEGIYKLKITNNGDMLITKIKLNQNRVVLYKEAFLAQSDAYFNNFSKTSHLYFKAFSSVKIKAKTYHKEALQKPILIGAKIILLDNTNVEDGAVLPASENFYKISSYFNDIIITGPEVFAFSEDSWFNPFSSKKAAFKEDLKYLEDNADYILVDYALVKNDSDGWKIASTRFNTEGLYIKDNKLSTVFNVPHLAENKNETNTRYIPIDWVNITVHKEGIF